jgi:hypothetical protein
VQKFSYVSRVAGWQSHLSRPIQPLSKRYCLVMVVFFHICIPVRCCSTEETCDVVLKWVYAWNYSSTIFFYIKTSSHAVTVLLLVFKLLHVYVPCLLQMYFLSGNNFHKGMCDLFNNIQFSQYLVKFSTMHCLQCESRHRLTYF